MKERDGERRDRRGRCRGNVREDKERGRVRVERDRGMREKIQEG